MSMLTVRNLDPEVKAEIQRRAARKGRSMEAEVRDILSRAAEDPDPDPELNLAQAFAQAYADIPPEWIPDFERLREFPREIEL